jgi:hypothetical protein
MGKRARLAENPFASLPGIDGPSADYPKQLRDFVVKLYSAGPSESQTLKLHTNNVRM